MPAIYKNGKNYGGGAIVDSALSSTSTNPVQNKVVKQALDELILNFANYYNKTEVDNIVNTIKNSRFEAVSTLPTTDIKTNVIYLVPKLPTQTNNAKDEYINLDGTSSGWEKIGDTEIDLSGYVTTNALNTALANYTTTTDLTTLLNNKVDKAQGKGLSTNDYTNAEKQKLANIESNAQANVQSDWNEDDTEDDGYIKNKPNLSTSLTATGNPLTIESSESNLVECVAEVEAVQDLHGYDKPWVGGAGKNLLPMTFDGIKSINEGGTWSGNVCTANGLTFTILTDTDDNVTGIKVSGTASDLTFFKTGYYKGDTSLNYTMNGCPSGGSTSNGYRLAWYYHGYDTGNGLTSAGSNTSRTVQIEIDNGVSIPGLIFYPMIRLATETDATFEPYENKSSITGQTEVVIEDVGKNLCPINNINGTLYQNIQCYLPQGTYTISAEATSTDTDANICIAILLDVNGSSIQQLNFSRGRRYYNVFTTTKDVYSINFYASDNYTHSTNDTFAFNDIQIEPGSTTSDFEPYKGKTYRVEIGQKNKWDFESYLNAVKASQSGFTWSESNGEYTISNHLALDLYGEWKFSDYDIPITISLKTKGNGGQGTYIMAYDKNDNRVGTVNTNTTNTDFKELSLTATCSKIKISYANSGSMIYKEPMIRSTIDDSEFVPYNPNLPSAIYGGELDVLTGKLRVTHGEVDLGDLNYTYEPYNTRFCSSVISGIKRATVRTLSLICSCYQTIDDGRPVGQVPDSAIYNDQNTEYVYIKDSRYTSESDFKTAVTGQTLVFPLATPYTIQLTPQQIKLLKGTNHLSCNTGDLSIKYYPDNVLGQLKGDIESEYDERIEALEEKGGDNNAMQKGVDYVTAGQLAGSTLGAKATAEGSNTVASGTDSHAEGDRTSAKGNYSHAEGNSTTASGETSHAEGIYTIASNYASHAGGHYNAAMTTGGTATNTTGTAFAIGNGVHTSALSNAFSVQYNGVVKAASTITASTTADYAEFFEWSDENPNNEDRVGYFVTVDENEPTKIRIANSNDDYILGIVSGDPFVLGNGDCDVWNGMVMRDEFRRIIYEPAQKYEINPETGEEEPVYDEDGNPVYEGTKPVYNPEYDPTIPYISRFDRPEWSPVGMLGVLNVRDDGSCTVNGYCTVGENGIATKTDSFTQTSYKVIARINSNIIKVIFR